MIGNKEKLKKYLFQTFIPLFYYDDDTLLFIVDTPVV